MGQGEQLVNYAYNTRRHIVCLFPLFRPSFICVHKRTKLLAIAAAVSRTFFLCCQWSECRKLSECRSFTFIYPLTGRGEGNMGLYFHRNHLGLVGTGKLGGREFLYLTPTRYTVTIGMILH